MTWKKSKFDATFTKLTCGEYEIVELYEPTSEGRYQLNKGDMYLATGSQKLLKEYAEFYERFH